MLKLIRYAAVFLVAAALAVAVAVPLVVPPVVERLLADRIAELGFAPDVHMRLGYGWRNGPGICGTLRVALRNTPWCVRTRFGASCCEWSAEARLDETAFDESDPTLAALLKRHQPATVSNLTFSGSISLSARAERTFSMPVPVWSARATLKGLSADLLSDGQPYSVRGLSATPAASGIAGHLDVAPLFLRARSVCAAGLALTNLSATVRATERAFMVSEATAGFCGGTLSVYSLFLNPENLNAGFTLLLDEIDAGQALRNFNGFRGDASGRLHGKIRLFVRAGGRRVRLREAFLYSTPGEPGALRMENPDALTDNLALAGLDASVRDNVANALSDLDYTALRLDLARTDGSQARLTAHVAGSATRGAVTVPVNITVNFNGELEQLINLGLGCSAKLKGEER